jgi:hypothetical protein
MRESGTGGAAAVLPADFVSRIRHPKLSRLYLYWLSRRGDRRFPRRSDIDPLDFAYMLGHIMLVDVRHGEPGYFVRLHGTAMVQRAHYDLTGKFIEDLPITEYRAYVLQRCESVVASGAPAIVRTDRVLDGAIRRYEALWLPFSEDGQAVSLLLCALFYDGEQ